jgi:hypothetical protein
MQSVNSALGGCLNPDAPLGCVPIPAPSPEEPLQPREVPPVNVSPETQRAPSNAVSAPSKSSKSSNSSSKAGVIAGATALAVAALLAGLLLFIVVRRRKQRAASKVSEESKRGQGTQAGLTLGSLASSKNAGGLEATSKAGPNAFPASAGAVGEREAVTGAPGTTPRGDGGLGKGHTEDHGPPDCKPASSLASPRPVAATDKGYTSAGTAVPSSNASGEPLQLPSAIFGSFADTTRVPGTIQSSDRHSDIQPQVTIPAQLFLPAGFINTLQAQQVAFLVGDILLAMPDRVLGGGVHAYHITGILCTLQNLRNDILVHSIYEGNQVCECV